MHAQKLELQLAEILQDEKTPDTNRWLEINRLQNQLEKLALFRLKSNAPSLMPFVTQSLAKTSPLIDIVDDDEDQAYQIGVALEDNGYRVRYFTDLNRFLAAWDGGDRADAVIMDLIFPQGEMAGTAVLLELKAKLGILPPVIRYAMILKRTWHLFVRVLVTISQNR